MTKKILSIILISVSVVAAKAQSFDKKNVALCYFNVIINSNLEIIPNKAIADSIYKEIYGVLNENAGIELKSVDFLKDNVKYFLGYPIGRAKNAAKSKKCNNYVKIVIDISPDGIFTTKDAAFTVAGIGKEKKKVNTKIKVGIVMIIYDENGEKIKDLQAKATSKDKIIIDSESLLIGDFSFINKKKNDSNFDTFQNILYQAAADLANKSN
ncbi:MAG: hypothetical protein WCI31_14415 [Prolixibacteraceae bacterium]